MIIIYLKQINFLISKRYFLISSMNFQKKKKKKKNPLFKNLPKFGPIIDTACEGNFFPPLSFLLLSSKQSSFPFLSHCSMDFWKILMVGPTDTPYEGGVFSLYAEFPYNYPEAPPTIRFVTPVSFVIQDI